MGVTRDRGEGAVTITQDNYTKSLLERYGMENCNLRYTPGVGSDLFLNKPEEKLLNKEDTQRFQAITDSVMYLGLVVRYEISYSVNQLTRALPKSSKSHTAVIKHLLRYLAGATGFTVRYKQGVSTSRRFRTRTGATTQTTATQDPRTWSSWLALRSASTWGCKS